MSPTRDACEAVGKRFDAAMMGGLVDSRVLFVVGKDGRIAKVMRPFREIDPTAYTELKEAIAAARK